MKKIILYTVALFTWIAKAQEAEYEMLMTENQFEVCYLIMDDSLDNFYIFGKTKNVCNGKETETTAKTRLFEFWVKVIHKKSMIINGIVYSNTYDMKRYLMDWKNKKIKLLAHITYNEDENILWSSYFDNKEYLKPFTDDLTLNNIHQQLGKPLRCRYIIDEIKK